MCSAGEDTPMALPNGQVFCRSFIQERAYILVGSHNEVNFVCNLISEFTTLCYRLRIDFTVVLIV